MIKDSIRLLLERKDLSGQQMQQTMQEILRGVVGTADIVSFLSALGDKGETIDELTAAVKVMLEYVEPIVVDRPHILDTCGTGGDKKGTFNISTVTAFVASGAGAVVAKHGNRSVTSSCGSADILEALGVSIIMDREKIRMCLEEIGIAFLFAPHLHPAMKHVMPARKQISKKTMFNIIGPLINPARATNQLVGVYSASWTAPLARVLANLGTHHCLVVHGEDGLDEATTTKKTFVSEAHNGIFRDYEIAPSDFGIAQVPLAELAGGDVERNKQIALAVLRGQKGACRDIVLLNTGCALYAADVASSIEQGIEQAKESIDSGAALNKLELLKEYSRR